MNPELAKLLEGYPVVFTIPVQWGDQDAFGHVNNTIYLRWLESARILYGERIGIDRMLKAEKIGWVLAAIHCNFRYQVTYPDTIHAAARIAKIGRTSLSMEHTLISEAGGVVAADSSSVLVVFDYNARKSHAVPEEMRRQIEAVEGKAF